MMIRSMTLVVLVLLLLCVSAAGAAAPEAGLAASAVMSAQYDGVEGATPADRSPLEDLNPADSSWQVWIGPILIGVFALVLAFLIRRFSLGGRNGTRGGDDKPSSD